MVDTLTENDFGRCGGKNGDYCASLQSRLGDQHSKGLVLIEVMNLKKHTTWAFAAYKQTAKDRGVVLNFCPFCGKGLHLPPIKDAAVA